MPELNQYQIKIINSLIFKKEARFSQLNTEKLENDHFKYHIKSLLKNGFLYKNENKKYELTLLGKDYANRIDTDKVKILKQAKIGVFICAVRNNGNKEEYLLMTRLKHPFFGCQGFMSGKVQYGEKVIDTAKREFFEESGLIGNPQIVSIRHYMVFDKETKNLLEDKFIYYCKVENPIGEIKSNGECKFEWVPEDKLEDFIKKPVESFDSFLSELDEIRNFSAELKFKEIEYESCNY